MIYLITGVPGSGKSLYAVSTLLQKLLKEVIKTEGGPDIPRRLCVDGIPNLLIPHELMASPAATLTQNLVPADSKPPGLNEGHGLWNWFTWCRPGDVICVDEVQRYWRPRGMGTKPPEEIAKLEVHRHYGVDLVLITQNAMLLDQNVRRLVGRHIHVRRIFGGARALIYDWDGCQTDTNRTQGASRSVWSYPKNAYKLYKSSELHTKQHQKIPLWFGFPLVVVGMAAFAGPKAYDAMSGSVTGKGVVKPASVSQPLLPASSPKPQSAPASAAPAAVPAASAQVLANAAPRARVLGCVQLGPRCSCFGDDGNLVPMQLETCEEGTHRVGTVVPLASSRGIGGVAPDGDTRVGQALVEPAKNTASAKPAVTAP